MIGKLKGLVETLGDDHLLIDVGGVCYLVYCSGSTLAKMPPVGEAVAVFIETYVREDQITLFGFATSLDKEWFAILRTVQGVGAKVALAIQATLSPSEIASAIALQDKAMVSRAPGVGPKVAQRIVTELAGKAPASSVMDAGVVGLQVALGAGDAPSNVADAVSALGNLGFQPASASAAIARIVAREGDDLSAEALIGMGLKELAK